MKLQQIFIAEIFLITFSLPVFADYKYESTKESAEKWQLEEAQTTLQTFFGGCVKDFKVHQDHIELTMIDPDSGVSNIKRYMFSDMQTVGLVYGSMFLKPDFFSIGYHSNSDKKYHNLPGCNVRGGDSPWKGEGVKKLADALMRLKLEYDKVAGPDSEAKFLETVTAYRAANPKPDLSEEARKFKVQAEFAVAQKHFSESADLYAKALTLAPWWPEGHFNRALVSGEIGSYNEAIHEMKHYLLLAPDAPNARAAQDKIYQWESMVSK